MKIESGRKSILSGSIQRRLPLTYAGIALLVALSLGGVLLGTLSQYYRQQEIDYLERNSRIITASLSPLMRALQSDNDLQSQINLFAFLSRTQIDVFASNDQLIAQSDMLTSVLDLEEPGIRLIVQDTQEEGTWVGLPSPPPPKSIELHSDFVAEDTLDDKVIFKAFADENNAGHLVEEKVSVDFLASVSNTVNYTRSVVAQDDEVFVNFESGLYGFGFAQSGDDVSSSVRSNQSISQPILDNRGNPLGSLRLSGGPAYGVEIVNSVALGWLLASVFSVTLAIIVGYIISRDVSQPLQMLTATTRQMAAGNLATRTNLRRNDELGTLAKAFDDMATQIEATVSTLQHFVSDAAHEINTPITALRTNLELIDATQSTQHNQSTLDRALLQVKRLEDLTRNLLQLSRLESGVLDESVEVISIVPIVRDTVGFYASRADQANVQLELSFPKKAVFCKANENHLRTALSNLIENALKFTSDGGRVTISVEECDAEVAIHIRDTGIGIPPEHLSYIFNRFHRAPNASSYAGSGLGLSIVHAIIEQYRGTVVLKNLERGTRATICLPIQS